MWFKGRSTYFVYMIAWALPGQQKAINAALTGVALRIPEHLSAALQGSHHPKKENQKKHMQVINATYFCNIVARSTIIFAFISKTPGDSSTLRTAFLEFFL